MPHFVRWCVVAAALVAIVIACACNGQIDTQRALTARSEVYNRGSQGLAVGTLSAASGTYGASCQSRSGKWSLRLSGSGALPNPALSVVEGDTSCTLTLTELDADATYTLSPTISLSTGFQGSPSAVASGTKRFYVNARLSAVSYSSDFVLTLLYSDDPATVTGSATASFASVNATATTTAADAPNYTIDFTTSPAMGITVNASYVVTSVSGKATLNAGSIAGSSYVVDSGTLGASPTFAEIDAVYTGGSATTISTSNPQIDATAFGLVGVSLASSAVRTVVVRRVTSGVPSYQAIRVTFSRP